MMCPRCLFIFFISLIESENTMLSNLSALTIASQQRQTPLDIYVFCGSDHFDRSIFIPITNEPYLWNKPCGGMWSSPVNSDNTWEDWCRGNGFKLEKLNKQFRFILTERSRVLRIKYNKDLDDLYSQGYKRSDFDQYSHLLDDDLYYLDFEKILANGYDAIQVTITDETYFSLYGWDCDTLLVLNPDSVIEIE